MKITKEDLVIRFILIFLYIAAVIAELYIRLHDETDTLYIEELPPASNVGYGLLIAVITFSISYFIRNRTDNNIIIKVLGWLSIGVGIMGIAPLLEWIVVIFEVGVEVGWLIVIFGTVAWCILEVIFSK